MNDLIVISEGPTELTFVRDHLAAHLPLFGTNVWPVLSGRNRNRGGVQKWEVARRDIVNTLKEKRYCSTMFDYYAMPNDWPGREESSRLPWDERAAHVEEQMLLDITEAMGERFRPKFFIPYVQMHEFEALAFADVQILAEVVTPISNSSTKTLVEEFAEILNDAGHPEAINDSYETCPSRRITSLVPAYRKPLHGPIITGRIGLDVLREKCDHFASWLGKLESL